MKNKVYALYASEELSRNNTFVHKLHPLVKLISTVVFIITAVSFERYAFGRMAPFVFYIVLLTAFSETPCSYLFKRFLIALPFCLFAGITNVIFDTSATFVIGSVTISCGVVSFAVILFKSYLCVMAVLLLVSVTPFSDLTNEMRRLKIPGIFIAVFEMIYRYIGVLIDEAYSMYTAYLLRSGNKKAVDITNMGSFLGQLLLRSLDRADRVYNAMKCRGGIPGSLPQRRSAKSISFADMLYLFVVTFFCVIFRFFIDKWYTIFL